MVTNNNNDIGPAKDKKVLIFVVCYKAADSIESVLGRIPADIWNNERFDAEAFFEDVFNARRQKLATGNDET